MILKHRWSAAFRASLIALALIVVHVGPQSAIAGAPAQLTNDRVMRLIESFPRIKILAVSQALAKGKDLATVKSPLEAVMKFAADPEVRLQADAAAKDHGFRDFEEWALIARATAAAYLHLKTGGSPGETEKAIDKALSQIRDAGFLSEKQKRKLEKKAREELGEDGELSTTPENLAVVKSLEKDLDAIVKQRG